MFQHLSCITRPPPEHAPNHFMLQCGCALQIVHACSKLRACMFLRHPKQKNDSMSNLPGVYLHLSILEHVAITTASVRYLESVVTNVTRILSVFLTSYARLSTPGARNVRRHLCCLLKVLSWWALIRSHWFRITYLPKVESMSPYNYGYRGTGIHDRTTPTRLRSRIYLFIHILGPDRWWTNRKVFMFVYII